jgi:hypothetical protein
MAIDLITEDKADGGDVGSEGSQEVMENYTPHKSVSIDLP